MTTGPSAKRISSKPEQLMTTARHLFYRDGYRAVGIDTVLAEADVAKMTLYNHFKSKDDLIVAVLNKCSTEVLNGVAAKVEQAGSSPTRRLLALFDFLEEFFGTPDFNGCAFIRALSEFPEVEHPVHRAAWRHKEDVTAALTALAKEAGVKDAKALAESLRLLADGALVAAHATHSTKPAVHAKSVASHLIKLSLA